MDLYNTLQTVADMPSILPREEKLLETINVCQECHFLREKDRLLTYWEFLWSQFRYTRKRWWALQGALLWFAWQVLPAVEDSFYRMRSLGVSGCLFVVLMIPELWRNKENDAIQVEAACLYSLRQVYAARITLFGMADIVFLTLFCLGLGQLGFTGIEVMSQFLLPVTVTACICFSLLCGKSNFGETVSLAACLIFGGAWRLVLMNERLYGRILPPVWGLLFGMALVFLTLAVRKTVSTTNQYWEVAYT